MQTPDFTILHQIRQRRPLIHCVSNLVSANDCANLVLAAGASPIMAQAPQEAAHITASASSTVLNTGTPSEEKFRACLLAGQEAARINHPITLDPVGVGASPWRLESVNHLLKHFAPAILRVNLGEAQALTNQDSGEQGVDSLTAATQSQRLETALRLAKRWAGETAVLLSGPEDILTNGTTAWSVSGGSAQMSQITGTGCMLSVLCGVFSAAEPNALAAAVLAASFWKTCARRAEEAHPPGPGSFRTALLDAAATLTPAACSASARIRRLL